MDTKLENEIGELIRDIKNKNGWWEYTKKYFPTTILKGLDSTKSTEDIIFLIKQEGEISDEAAAHLLLGILLGIQRDYKESFEHIKQANKISPENPFIANTIGFFVFKIHGKIPAKKRISFLEDILPSHIAQYWMGLICIKIGNYAEAIKSFEYVLTEETTNENARFFYAFSLYKIKKAEEVLQQFEKISNTFSISSFDYNLTEEFNFIFDCDIDKKQDKTKNNSNPSIESAIKHYTRDACYDGLAILYFKQGNILEAIIQLQQVRTSDFNVFLLSKLYEQLGKFRKAQDIIFGWYYGCKEKAYNEQCDEINSRYHMLEEKIVNQPLDLKRDFPNLIERLQTPRFTFFKEKILSQEILSSNKENVLVPISSLSELKKHPIIYAGRDKEHILAISVSQDIDQRGEISSGGYWAYLSFDEGKHWTLPLYMGFAEQFPYIISTNHRISPFNNDSIQIEVELREIDESTITFPPVGLRVKRVKKDIYLEYPLTLLMQDSDKDGLTDLYEEKIATDPYQKDTDRDGKPDDTDWQPLTPLHKEFSEESQIVLSALNDILGQKVVPIQISAEINTQKEKPAKNLDSFIAAQRPQQQPFTTDRVLFIESEQPIFAECELPIRVIVLPHQAVELYEKKFGSTFMLHIDELIFNIERTEAFFEYSFGWYGGSIRAKKINGKWKCEIIKEWVT